MSFREHRIGELRSTQVNTQVKLAGWVAANRSLGQMTFLVLRDISGKIQLLIDPEYSLKSLDTCKTLKEESVIAIKGVLKERPANQQKDGMGAFEVWVDEITVLNPCEGLPFPIQHEEAEVSEAMRLKYRYLDLRRETNQTRMLKRSQLNWAYRKALQSENFLDIETPFLYKSTPEGAREFIVPSRQYPGKCYALPQSPQLFKQLLMMSGFDRYYQITKCFRDEANRSDRQPEFTQIDCETSFLDRDAIMDLFEAVTKSALKDIGFSLDKPFRRLSYQEAKSRYGSDKPDLRFDLPIYDLSTVAQGSSFLVFEDVLKSNGVIQALCLKQHALSRKEIDLYTDFVKGFGAKGLAWIKADANQALQSPIAKFFKPEHLQKIVSSCDFDPADTVLIVSGDLGTVRSSLGALRAQLGKDKNLYDPKVVDFSWVIDFPMFEKNDEGRFVACHHPFTAPKCWDDFANNPEKAVANAYDLVCNGHEIAGGSVRIFDPKKQRQVFEFMGLSSEEIDTKFGFLLEALQYGAPPHGGIAFGLDRLAMILTGTDNIKDVIAFPKTNKGQDLMVQSPQSIEDEELKIYHIQKADGIQEAIDD
jgi:aspartyl-tRNA synthetase